ncbi:MAG: DMT family transporter [Proteobacteria bacterium]|nr:DMT family transporter [Pseudomonadota bacterium]
MVEKNISKKLYAINDRPAAEYYLGMGLIMLSALTFSTAGLFTKGVAAGAWEVIFWRGIFAVGFTVCWSLSRGTQRHNYKMGVSGIGIAVVGALGTAAFISSFKFTSIANVSLIYAISPLIAALLAWFVMGERISVRMLIGCLTALIGVAIIVSGSLGQISLTGDMLALWMTFVMALTMVLYRRFPATPTAGPAILSSLLLLPAALFFGAPFAVKLSEIAILAAFGLLFAIATVTLAEGAKRVPSGQTALLSSLETPLAPIFAFLLLAEVPNSATYIGGALILMAVLLAIRREAPSS